MTIVPREFKMPADKVVDHFLIRNGVICCKMKMEGFGWYPPVLESIDGGHKIYYTSNTFAIYCWDFTPELEERLKKFKESL